jgi:hypothetical protein
MAFICKKCRKAFRKDAREFEDSYALSSRHAIAASLTFINRDEYCPHCDNHFVLNAVTPKASLNVEGEDARIDSRSADSANTKICPLSVADGGPTG